MPTLLDLLYVAFFAVATPLWDYLVSWPSFYRQLQADPARARKRLWIGGITYLWVVVALGAALWRANDRAWSSLGFTIPVGWRLWLALGLVLLLLAYNVQAIAAVARDSSVRAKLRGQMGKLADIMGPHTRTEMNWFAVVSLTAGFCEEFLYRGYFIWALAPWLGWWGAAALSALIFALGHAYQGWDGVIRTGIVGVLYTVVVAVTGSLWPAIALHVLIDLGSGTMAWLALRAEQAIPDAGSLP